MKSQMRLLRFPVKPKNDTIQISRLGAMVAVDLGEGAYRCSRVLLISAMVARTHGARPDYSCVARRWHCTRASVLKC